MTSPNATRLDALRDVRQRIDAEITILENAKRLAAAFQPKQRRRSRHVIPACGSETAYQRHARNGDTATGDRRVTCEPCLAAHASYERTAAAIRRATHREAS